MPDKKIPATEELVEAMAKAFCEASGRYKWDDTTGSLRDWYLDGVRAIVAFLVEEGLLP